MLLILLGFLLIAREKKQKILEDCKKSPLSKIKFCKEQKIAPSTLHNWLKEAKLEPFSHGFSPVNLTNSHHILEDQTLIEVTISSHTIFRFSLPIKNLVVFLQEFSHATSTLGNKIWIFKKPVDFRASIDGLSALITREQESIFFITGVVISSNAFLGIKMSLYYCIND